MTAPERFTQRVRARHIDWVDARLSHRDRCVLTTVATLRLATGKQLERICFATLNGQSRTVVRGRVLARLVNWRVLRVVDRRIGGPTHGSTSAIYELDSAGLALAGVHGRPGSRAGERFTKHTLAVGEVYADTVEATATHSGIVVAEFYAEPACWTRNGVGGYLKHDAYLQLRRADLALHWWLEVDRSTESVPTLGRKLRAYLDFVERGQIGPHGVMPRVLVTVPDEARRAAVADLIQRLPQPATQLFAVDLQQRAACVLLGVFRE